MKLRRSAIAAIALCFGILSWLLPCSARAGLNWEGESYAHRWAVIVGINYAPVAGENTGIPPLQFAEDDAKAVRDVLVNHYGFLPQNVKLLLGSGPGEEQGGAKKDDIERELATLWNSQISKDDCVLFFFSGHGYSRTTSQGVRKGQLLASNAKFQDMRPNEDGSIDLSWVVDRLKEDCKARHKLVVLDCCHSGAIFAEFERRAANQQEAGETDSPFKDQCFQAMVACRALERAQDGKNGHSPFTGALLDSLLYLPSTRDPGTPIRVRRLFEDMKPRLDLSLPNGQSPSCSYITDHQGEFHFFPDPESKFPEPEVPEEQVRRLMIAMVPGSFGNWWFSETPWFMPGLRYDILDKSEAARGLTPEVISPESLRHDAQQWLAEESTNTESRHAMRRRHLEKMLEAKGEDWNRVVMEVMSDLEKLVHPATANSSKPAGSAAAVKPGTSKGNEHSHGIKTSDSAEVEWGSDLDPVDVHFLACLMHGTGVNRAAAKLHYQKAIELYKERAKTNLACKALLALCYADLGWFHHDVAHEYELACQCFLSARSQYAENLTPQPFRIYVRCREADSLSRLGRTGAAKACLASAEQALDELDPTHEYPISAAYYHREAWLDMDWCAFDEAIANFDKSSEILSHKDLADNTEAAILRFHNKHGHAMAVRFSGDRDGAMYMYRELLQDISREIGHRRDDTSHDMNFRQVKLRMVERWVNTLERLGDCSLFGQPTDASEAADDYRRAIRACSYLSPEMRSRWEQRVRYKYALALALPNTSVQDLDLSEQQLKTIDNMVHPKQAGDPLELARWAMSLATGREKVAGHDVDDPSLAAQQDAPHKVTDASAASPEDPKNLPKALAPYDATRERDIAICKRITNLLLAHCRCQQSTTEHGCDEKLALDRDTNKLRDDLRELLEENRLNSSLRRDEVEAALFCVKLLMDELENPAESDDPSEARRGRIVRRDDVELLLGFCRLARPRSSSAKEKGAISSSSTRSLLFLRPYYDSALEALLALQPHDAKQLIEVAHEARLGKTHFKPHSVEATLVLYCGAKDNYIFLDVPRSTSAYYVLPRGISARSLQDAVAARQPLHELPGELQRELQLLASPIKEKRLEVRVCFQDPVKGLGRPITTALTTAKDPSLVIGPSEPPRAFPFDLPIDVVQEVIDGPAEAKPADPPPATTAQAGE